MAEDVPTVSMFAIPIRNDYRAERDLPAGQGERVHLRIGERESNSEKMEETLQSRPGIGEGLPDNEVLHAVGSDEHGVVAVGVGGEKLLAKDLDVDFAGEYVVVAAGERRLGNGHHIAQWRREHAVDRDTMLPVGDLKRVLRVSASRARYWGCQVILHDIAEAMPGDPPDLAQRRLDLGAAVVAQTIGERGRDGVLLGVPGTDDEREAESGLVLRIGVLEPGDLLFAENIRVKTGGALLALRFARERSG